MVIYESYTVYAVNMCIYMMSLMPQKVHYNICRFIQWNWLSLM